MAVFSKRTIGFSVCIKLHNNIYKLVNFSPKRFHKIDPSASKRNGVALAGPGDPGPEVPARVAEEKVVIPVLMFACNRVTVNRALDNLLKIRKDAAKFPVIVSQVEKYSVTGNFFVKKNCPNIAQS
jgi:hypothetical protein